MILISKSMMLISKSMILIFKLEFKLVGICIFWNS